MTVLNGGAATTLSLALVWGSHAQAQEPTHQPPAAPTSRVATDKALATFVNPLYKGQDPAYVQKDGYYYLCQTGPGHRIEVWKSPTLTHRGERATVWTAPRRGWNAQQVWAPELHFVRGKWYIYYAASNGFNENHRMGVLEAATDDPQGEYIDRGVLYTGDDIHSKTNNRWAIDGTVFEHRGQLYFAWSGWEDGRDVQYTYLAPMSDPVTVSGGRVKLCGNDTYLWERVGETRRERGLHEGPAVLVRNGRVMIVYSCSGSWQHTYKLGLLYADESADLLDPKSWHKLASPVFQSTDDVFGVGHCSFVKSPDGSEDWIAYHAKTSRRDGWDRQVYIQKFSWREDGLPEFGVPVNPRERIVVPSGEGVLREGPVELKPAASSATHGAAMPMGVAASPR